MQNKLNLLPSFGKNSLHLKESIFQEFFKVKTTRLCYPKTKNKLKYQGVGFGGLCFLDNSEEFTSLVKEGLPT